VLLVQVELILGLPSVDLEPDGALDFTTINVI